MTISLTCRTIVILIFFLFVLFVQQIHKKECSEMKMNSDKPEEEVGGLVVWPRTAETPAMINSPMPCYLTMHPNMRFKATFRSCRGSLPFPVLVEDLSIAGRDIQNYLKLVPLHKPFQMSFAVVGEVIFTQNCYWGLKEHYDSYPGKHFAWPGIEAITICPGTGKTVGYGDGAVHILVAGNVGQSS